MKQEKGFVSFVFVPTVELVQTMKISKTPLSAQIRHFSGSIESNSEWEMAGIYADEGVSGKSKKKPRWFEGYIKSFLRGIALTK